MIGVCYNLDGHQPYLTLGKKYKVYIITESQKKTWPRNIGRVFGFENDREVFVTMCEEDFLDCFMNEEDYRDKKLNTILC